MSTQPAEEPAAARLRPATAVLRFADEPPTEHESDYHCSCEELEEFDLLVEEGDLVLMHPTCNKPVNLDAIGWFVEAPEMLVPVRVSVEFVIERGMGGQEPSHILMTPVKR